MEKTPLFLLIYLPRLSRNFTSKQKLINKKKKNSNLSAVVEAVHSQVKERQVHDSLSYEHSIGQRTKLSKGK